MASSGKQPKSVSFASDYRNYCIKPNGGLWHQPKADYGQTPLRYPARDLVREPDATC